MADNIVYCDESGTCHVKAIKWSVTPKPAKNRSNSVTVVTETLPSPNQPNLSRHVGKLLWKLWYLIFQTNLIWWGLVMWMVNWSFNASTGSAKAIHDRTVRLGKFECWWKINWRKQPFYLINMTQHILIDIYIFTYIITISVS